MTSSERLLLHKKEPILHNEGTNSSINWAEWNKKLKLKILNQFSVNLIYIMKPLRGTPMNKEQSLSSPVQFWKQRQHFQNF